MSTEGQECGPLAIEPEKEGQGQEHLSELDPLQGSTWGSVAGPCRAAMPSSLPSPH